MIDQTDVVYKENSDKLDKIKRGARKERLKVPIPVIGEAFMKLSKNRDPSVKRDAFRTLDKLIADKRVELVAFGHGSDAFTYAKQLMEVCNKSQYSQDTLYPMDALIIADAIIDNECSKVYTSDFLLLMNEELQNKVNEIRANIDKSYGKLKFRKL